jgi:antitoxin (DNA-binding transcriptional repressor) of toxin-antitoxin stability system
MKTVDINEAQSQLSRLVEAAAAGEKIAISVSGVRTAMLGPVTTPRRRFGLLKGQIKVSDDFDAPLPPQVITDFEGG